jgi:transcriptional regulator with PAS, ATPase and Fis domain
MILNDIMSKDVPFLFNGDNIGRAGSLFRRSSVDVLPVVGKDMRPVGVFTRKNFIDAVLKKASLDDLIDPYLSEKPGYLPWDTPCEALIDMIETTRYGTAPVLDEEGKICGILSKANLVLFLLRRSELLNAQFKAVLDAMHNAVVAVDRDKKVILINRSAEMMLKLAGEDCSGSPLEELLPGIELDDAMDGKARAGYKYKLGKTVTIMNILPISGTGSEAVDGAVIVMQDLTQFEKVARELEIIKELNRTLDTVLNIINDGIVVVDRDGVLTLVNQVMADYLNTTKHDLAGRHVTDIMKNSRLHIVARSGVPEMSEIMHVEKDQLIVSHLPVTRNGKTVGAVGKIIFPHRAEIKELAKKLNALQSKLAYYKDQLKKAPGEGFDKRDIIAVSSSMIGVKNDALQVARSSSTVLITGESGTGKELIARAIHAYSSRCRSPFVMVNCAAIPDNLLESELFGYAPGAFTGADRSGKQGKFELADKGTIFLDEIGDMSMSLQAKILRVLQEKSFERLGSNKIINVDVRIVSATNKNLEKAILEGGFRKDLFYRLNVINLKMPSLRNRPDDIQPLADNIISRLNRIMNVNITGFTDDTMEILRKYHWPGNVRELENVLERAVNFASEGRIKPVHLPPYLLGCEVEEVDVCQDSIEDTIDYRIGRAEREAILKALEKTGGNRSKAANLLNMSRSRFYNKMRKLGMNLPKSRTKP